MSFFTDYVDEGLCCEQCGELIDCEEPGHTRVCAGCAADGRWRWEVARLFDDRGRLIYTDGRSVERLY